MIAKVRDRVTADLRTTSTEVAEEKNLAQGREF